MKKIFIFLSFILLSFITYTQEFISSAYHKNFEVKEYDAQPQNWEVIQDNRGIMYFANTECVLEYDGTNWRKIKTNFAVRSVVLDSKNRIYVCGTGDFGYLTPDKIGEMKYISISSRIDTSKLKTPPDVWSIKIKNNEIYFQTPKKIFKFSPYSNKDSIFDDSKENLDKIKVFKTKKEFINIFYKKNKIIVLEDDGYLSYLENDKLIETPYNKFFTKKEKIKDLNKFDNNKLLFAFSEKLMIYDEIKDTLLNFKTDADDFLKKNLIYSCKRISNNKFSIGTRNGGVIIINKNGKVLDIFNKENILKDNTCFNQMHKDGISWFTLNIGISKIETGSAFRFLGEKNNVGSPILSIIKHKKILYISSFAGISYLEMDKIKDKTKEIKFIEIPNTIQPVWDFQKFYTKKDTILFAAKTDGLFIVKKDKLEKISSDSYITIKQSLLDTNKLFTGSRKRIELLEYKNSKFKLTKIANLGGIILSIEEIPNGNIWVGTYFNFVFQLKKKNKSDNLPISEQYELCHYDTSNNLPTGRIKTYFVNNEIIFTTDKGIYKFDDKKEKFYKTDDYGKLFGKEKENPIYDLLIRKNGDIIADGNSILRKQKDNSYITDRMFSRRLSSIMTASMYELSDSIVLFGTSTNGLFIYNTKIDTRRLDYYNTSIREVICGQDSLLFFGTNYKIQNDSILMSTLKQEKHLIPILNYENNSLNFTYASQFYEAQEEIKYSYKLEGFDKEWSKWTDVTKKEYTNLYEGKYIFKVKAKNLYKDESKIGIYEFEILPPWQRTNLAYLSYIILGFIFIFIIVKLYTRRLKQQNVKLENIVQERTKEVVKQNEQIMEKNAELEQQKEEILTQSEELLIVNEEITLKNEMITSSITYAKTIQKAILPIDENMKKYFDFFNIFRPKDIVSGDFYWFTKLKIENKFFIFVAVVDCTGHGVPGAFMSMIGSRLLSEIVKERKIIDTAKILELLDDGIKKSLKQAQTENNDGMDLCLCRFEKIENEINVNFSGAKRPLFIFRNENNKIETIKPDRRSIGGAKEKRKIVNFTSKQTVIFEKDIIYLTTDGYIDQNNALRKRFGTKQFFEIVQENADKSFFEQKNILEKALDNWQKDESQRDDITVMGIKNIFLNKN